MTEVFALALSFPCVIYTVLLGVVLVYWLFVVVGAVQLGEGSDGALDGFDPEAALGAGKGALDGHLDGLAHPGSDAADFGDLDSTYAAEGHANASAVALLVNALHLRSVPATVISSLIVTFSWLVCTIGMQLVSRAPGDFSLWLRWSLLVLSPVVALPLTSLAARPLAKVFKHKPGTSRSDLIGKTCVVRTGTVTSTFGEALLEDGGAGLVVRVRVDRELPVKRGDQMLIVDWDSEHEAFLVEPAEELLGRPR